MTTYQPKKKPKGKELTPQEKERNRQISRERIGVEHSIGGVKVFAIVREVYRNMRAGFEDLIMETACALHNLRLDPPLDRMTLGGGTMPERVLCSISGRVY